MNVLGSFKEDAYFLVQDASRREEVRRRVEAAAAELEERAAVARAVATDDQELARRIQALGFNGDSARAFDLLPLLHVSWADGQVQARERTTILSLLHQRGIQPGSDAAILVEALLERRPSDAFMHQALELLRAVLGNDAKRLQTLVDLCTRVAEASGGLLGIGGRVSDEERTLIVAIAERLGDHAVERLRATLSAAP